jgi:hypothetical protein
MSKAKIVAFSLIAAALLSWQIASVDNAASGASWIVDACLCDATVPAYVPIPPDTETKHCWFSCPLGDGDRLDDIGAVISIHAFDPADNPIWGIPATDYFVLGCSDGLVLCGGGGSITADSASGVNGNTTMSGTLAASGCELIGLFVVIQGFIVEEGTPPNCQPKCLEFRVVTPDISGEGGVIDGYVELIDFGQFGLVYDKPALYDPCFDYNCDTEVELWDFRDFGLHWRDACHGVPPTS